MDYSSCFCRQQGNIRRNDQHRDPPTLGTLVPVIGSQAPGAGNRAAEIPGELLEILGSYGPALSLQFTLGAQLELIQAFLVTAAGGVMLQFPVARAGNSWCDW